MLAAATGQEGYDERPVLDDAGWATLLANLDRLADAAAARGVTATLHPHVGTMVETGEETERVLAGSGIGLCLDTGHLLIGGGDPVALAGEHPDRVAHVHLKDVDAGLGRAGARRATRLHRRRARRDVPPARARATSTSPPSSRTLEDSGYDGWYVLEQDTILAATRRRRRAAGRRADQPRPPAARSPG